MAKPIYALPEDDSGGISKKCHICGGRHHFFLDLFDYRPIGLFEWKIYDPFELEECENEEYDDEFANGLQWAREQTMILEGPWKEQAYMLRPARDRLDKYIIGFDYLDKIRKIAKKFKKRLQFPKFWCSHSLNLNVQLMKLGKVLNKRFEEIAMQLNGISLVEEVTADGDEARKTNRSSITRASKMHGSDMYSFKRQNTAEMLTLQLKDMLKKNELRILYAIQEQENKSLSARGQNSLYTEETQEIGQGGVPEVHMDHLKLERREDLFTTDDISSVYVKGDRADEEQYFDADEYSSNQNGYEIENTEEDMEFLDSLPEPQLTVHVTEKNEVFEGRKTEHEEEDYKPGMQDVQPKRENEGMLEEVDTELVDTLSRESIIEAIVTFYGESRTGEMVTLDNKFEEHACLRGSNLMESHLIFKKSKALLGNWSAARLSVLKLTDTLNTTITEPKQTEKNDRDILVVRRHGHQLTVPKHHNVQSSDTNVAQDSKEHKSDIKSATAASSETFLERKLLHIKSQSYGEQDFHRARLNRTSLPGRNSMKIFNNWIFKTLLLISVASAMPLRQTGTGCFNVTDNTTLPKHCLHEQLFDVRADQVQDRPDENYCTLCGFLLSPVETKRLQRLYVCWFPLGVQVKSLEAVDIPNAFASRKIMQEVYMLLELSIRIYSAVPLLRHTKKFEILNAEEENEKDIQPVQLKGEYTYENKFHCVSRSSTDKHYILPNNQHIERNSEMKVFIEGLLYAVVISIVFGGIVKEDGTAISFKYIVAGLCSYVIIGYPVAAYFCILKIPFLWILMNFAGIPLVLEIFQQKYDWMKYIHLGFSKCSVNENLRNSSSDIVLSEPVEEIGSSQLLKKEFNNREENIEIQECKDDEDSAEVVDLDQTEKLSQNALIRAEEEIQLQKKLEDEDEGAPTEEINSNTENINILLEKETFAEIRPSNFKPFYTFADEENESQENEFDTDILYEAETVQKKDIDWSDRTDNDREEADFRNDQGLQKANFPSTTSGLDKNASVHYIADLDDEENVQVLIPPVDQTLGSSQPLPDSNCQLDSASSGEDEFRNEKLKLKLQVVPNLSQSFCAQTNVKSVDQQKSPENSMECRTDTFFNLKYKVKEDTPRRRKSYLRCTEDDFERLQKPFWHTIRNNIWLKDLPVPKIDITAAYIEGVETNTEAHVQSNVPRFEPLLKIIDLIANGTPPTPHVSMRYELLRFCTLRSYPKENKPYLIKLAQAGFYYASDGDGVVCYCCGVRRYNWVAEDIPMKIHQRINPNCKFLRKNEEVNVPVQYYGPYSEALMAIMDIPEPTERTEQSEDVNNDWAPERVRSPAPPQQNRQIETGANSLGINTALPKHTQYATKTAREGSYSGWPDTASHNPQELADAGFFYAGFGDCVRCFYCGIGLRHWTKDDNPWIEHARWSRNCVFVKQKKGEEFVNLVQLAVQYSQDNEAQSNTSAGNQLPAQEIERILLSDAAQSVLEMGYQPRIIKKAIEQILRQNADAKITAQVLMEKVLEIEEAENPPQAAPAPAPEPAAAAAQAKPASQTAKPEASKPAESAESAAISNVAEKKSEGAKTSLEGKDKDKKESKELSDEATSQDPKAIKAENEQLKEQTLCKVCLDNTVCIVFLPCGHLVTCADCAPAMRKCPICRALVKGTVRTYMS